MMSPAGLHCWENLPNNAVDLLFAQVGSTDPPAVLIWVHSAKFYFSHLAMSSYGC